MATVHDSRGGSSNTMLMYGRSRAKETTESAKSRPSYCPPVPGSATSTGPPTKAHPRLIFSTHNGPRSGPRMLTSRCTRTRAHLDQRVTLCDLGQRDRADQRPVLNVLSWPAVTASGRTSRCHLHEGSDRPVHEGGALIPFPARALSVPADQTSAYRSTDANASSTLPPNAWMVMPWWGINKRKSSGESSGWN